MKLYPAIVAVAIPGALFIGAAFAPLVTMKVAMYLTIVLGLYVAIASWE